MPLPCHPVRDKWPSGNMIYASAFTFPWISVEISLILADKEE